MTSTAPTEQLVEDVASAAFGDVGATVKFGSDIDRAGERADASQVILVGRLMSALHRLNPELPHDACEQAVRALNRPPHPTLIENNRWFHAQLTGGVEVEFKDPATGELRGGRAQLLDFD